DLANSIKEHGILQPLIVTSSDEETYTLVAGERRLEAAKLAELAEVPAIVRDVSEQERLELAVIENVQREDLNPIESAIAYNRLVEEFGLSHESISKKVGKSRVTVTNTIRLLSLAENVQKALVENKVSEGHARAILGLKTDAAQETALKTVLEKELNVRQTEELVRSLTGTKTTSKPS
ncbi:MAG: ParB/RepB/Spo0J family partition protein, partial [candidate division Zixibacteria bacterium]|nr:ParB/RepB/Spo0J family partition protein [candidate division Zixibacteria bacterium]NIR47318.1 ParB/RepB/Spo0J family partition protein [candidate division KSB1 bacterium]NIW43625.1 ParB/RepB/Spo0J family partition protein [Gammaproteobacteria bacterium]NIR62663.1 ParB/RepB/Spo0J family partition protein [candidate division Zixibacteria bacterium]NIS44752.1 ParB/RepB/Spo0J family partition protein [candidate division Zixibacteria bacterium]